MPKHVAVLYVIDITINILCVFWYKYIKNIVFYSTYAVGWDSSVGIATRYGLDIQGVESRRERDFRHPSLPVLKPTQPSIHWVPGLSLG